MTEPTDYRRARKGKPANRGKRVSQAEFRRMWHDQSLTLEQIGARLWIHKATVSQRARTLGLPSRYEAITVHRPDRKIHDPDLCIAMLRFGVSIAEICAHFGISANSLKSFRNRHGEPGRKRGKCKENMRTVREFMEARAAQRLAERMAEVARAERAAVAEHWRAVA